MTMVCSNIVGYSNIKRKQKNSLWKLHLVTVAVYLW